MSTNVLNIASGFLPVVASDFGVDRVVNYDPLGKDSLLNLRFLEIASAFPDIEFCHRQSDVDHVYPNGSVDAVMSVSPYGFAVVDAWIDGKIKAGGFVVVAGHHANKYATKANNIFNGAHASKYGQMPKGLPWIEDIRAKILGAYPSQKTELGGTTAIDSSVVFLKKTA